MTTKIYNIWTTLQKGMVGSFFFLFLYSILSSSSNSYVVSLTYPAPLQFNFTGYKNVATLALKNCTTNVHTQINAILAGDPTIDVIKIPTTNPTLPHVSCSSDSFMGPANINFTLYSSDNDPLTGLTDKQRIEMKVFGKSQSNLLATNNTNYIYSWWFKLDSNLMVDKKFYHIFQIKSSVGTGVDTTTITSFTLTSADGFHLRLHHADGTVVYHDMLPMTSVVGKWIQAYVNVQFKNGSTPGAATSGSVQVILKDQSAKTLFQGLFYNDMFWNLATYYRPIWGLYRTTSPVDLSDWQLFNNIQIWKK